MCKIGVLDRVKSVNLLSLSFLILLGGLAGLLPTTACAVGSATLAWDQAPEAILPVTTSITGPKRQLHQQRFGRSYNYGHRSRLG